MFIFIAQIGSSELVSLYISQRFQIFFQWHVIVDVRDSFQDDVLAICTPSQKEANRYC